MLKEKKFLSQTREKLPYGIQDAYLLDEDESLVVKCIDNFEDEKSVIREPGDRWMIKGPISYVPPVEVEVITRRKAHALNDNEGIYVRNIKTGKIRAVIGQTYMLTEDEELWDKQLSADLEKTISYIQDSRLHRRNKHEVVTYRVPQDTSVQVFDFKGKKSRLVFGPDLVMLGPDEEFKLIDFQGMIKSTFNSILNICIKIYYKYSMILLIFFMIIIAYYLMKFFRISVF